VLCPKFIEKSTAARQTLTVEAMGMSLKDELLETDVGWRNRLYIDRIDAANCVLFLKLYRLPVLCVNYSAFLATTSQAVTLSFSSFNTSIAQGAISNSKYREIPGSSLPKSTEISFIYLVTL